MSDDLTPGGAGREAQSVVDAVARRSYGKLVAFLAMRTRDLAAAEDALGDAFASALAEWPRTGCPANPEAWLLTAARRKAIDAARRVRTGEAATGHLQLLAAEFEILARNRGDHLQPDQADRVDGGRAWLSVCPPPTGPRSADRD